MKKRKLLVTIVAVIMVLLLIVPMLTMIFFSGDARAVSQSDIIALQQQQTELKRQQDALQAKIDANKDKKSDISGQKKLLDQQIGNTQDMIDNFNAQITDLTDQITWQQQKYDDALKLEQALLQQFNKQLRSSEELGNVSYLSVLFGAKTFSDMLGMLDFVSQVYNNEQDTVNKLRSAKAEADTSKNALESSKTSLLSAKTVQEEQKTKLNSQLDQAHSLISQLDRTIKEENDSYEELEAAEQALAQQILELTKQLDAQNGNTSPNAKGNYIWPVSNRYITSPFGYRSDPISGVWKKHNGIDVGASYGDYIYAADGGQVVTSTYSSSYGNYVMISHGNGRYTLYAHMLKRAVDSGAAVYQGQLIGYVDSTGYSTGSHLHFEIIEDGAYVDALSYLTGYKAYWD